MREYLNFASHIGTLIVTFLVSISLLFLVFPIIPINGESLDVQSWYTYDEAMTLLEGYGSDGRTIYLWSSLLMDTLFPVMYVTFLAGLIHRFRLSDRMWWVALIPLVAGILDLTENVQISLMLISYPDVGELQTATAAIFTAAKHWMFYISGIIALALLAVSSARAFRRRFAK